MEKDRGDNSPELNQFRQGVIYKRFVYDNGQIEDKEDDLFSKIIMATAIAFYPVDIADFIFEVDMMRGEIPNFRIFDLNGVKYKLIDIPFEGWGTGHRIFAEALEGKNLGIRQEFEMDEFRVIKAKTLP